ncbi:MAG: M28 family peptidase [Victivallales bacterium]
MRVKFAEKKSLIRVAAILAAVAVFLAAGISFMISMPGKSYSGVLPELSGVEKEISSNLKAHVEHLALKIGQRNFLCPKGLRNSADYIEERFSEYGYKPGRSSFKADVSLTCPYRNTAKDDNFPYENIVAEIRGAKHPDEIIVIGAHYDSVPVDGCRAANDNASGVAAVLELARMFSGRTFARTVRFAAFPNEEPPFFQTSSMGSYVYAEGCKKKKENIVGMFSLETIGYYSDKPGSQNYPYPLNKFYPDKGDFIGFVGNVSSRSLVRKSVGLFREKVKFPSEGAALYGGIAGVGWSDHWAFWEMGYPALMVTDTAPFRYPFYHSASDNPDKLDFERMARVVKGLETVIAEIAD